LPSSHSTFGGDDEELAAVRIGAGVGHRERTADDRELERALLVRELVTGAAGAVAAGAACLDHEVVDDAVEHEAVVEAFAGELLEVLDRPRRVVVEEHDPDGSFARMKDRLAHPSLLKVRLTREARAEI
jgi:hypothetical protein